jgi:hypothetical protein
MYPRWMEIAGYCSLGVIGILVFLITIWSEGFYLAIVEVVGWLLIGFIWTWSGLHDGPESLVGSLGCFISLSLLGCL